MESKINKDEKLITNWKSFTSEEAFKEAARQLATTGTIFYVYNHFEPTEKFKLFNYFLANK